MKRTATIITVCLGLLFSGLVVPVRGAEEKTFMEQIEADKKVILESTAKVEKDKKDADALYSRGAAHFHLGQLYIVMYSPSYTLERTKIIKDEFESSAADFSSVIDLRPDLLQAYIMRGMSYGQMGLSNAAIADFTYVIKVDPKNSYAYYARGREYWAGRDYLKAKQDYDKAVELDPRWKDSFYR